MKRRLDIFLAVAGLLFFLPIMLLIALLIKLLQEEIENEYKKPSTNVAQQP